jgi:tRNA-modifying protein YgfZ
MNDPFLVDLGTPAIVEFRGPDAIRFLNGQVTQDVRKVIGGKVVLPSCVTDAKGRLQFRVHLMESETAGLWVIAPAETAVALEARLTRYLIADDVETAGLTGSWRLVHITGALDDPPPGAMFRESWRYGMRGTDCLVPTDRIVKLPEVPAIAPDLLEDLRIRRGIPAWGAELAEGMLPPEAGLDQTDISYTKGCYIGQEVISRIKSAGRVNRRLTRFLLEVAVPAAPDDALLQDGKEAGVLTSVSPRVVDGSRAALGYVKRGADPAKLALHDGVPVRLP